MPSSDLQLIEGPPLPYLLSIPPGSPPRAEGWPVLCFLHGYGEAAPLDIHTALTLHGPLRSSSAARATSDFIVVAPQLPVAGDVWHLHADTVQRIVREVQARYTGDPQRKYLTGFSYGGNGVMDLALLQRDVWAALWPVDPTRVPEEDPPQPLWLSIGAAARRCKQDFIRHLHLQAIDGAPAGDRLYLDQGEDHVGSAQRAYQDERIYDWLLAQKRSFHAGEQGT